MGEQYQGNPFTMKSPDEVADITLPVVVRELVERYNEQIGIRDEFLWQWIYSAFPSFTLNTVRQEDFEQVRTEKTILTMFITIIDDLAETTHDSATFLEAQKVAHPTATPLSDHSAVNADILAFIEHVWETLQETLTTAPQYSTYNQHYTFDLNQALNSIEYSEFISDNPGIANITESWAYGSHNMVMYAYTDIDLMHSPQIPETDVRELRKFLYDIQKMARIGNWVSTWEREIHSRDFAAGIVVKALEDGVVTVEELETLPPDDLITRVTNAGVEEYFLNEWDRLYEASDPTQYTTEKIDLDKIHSGMKTVLEYHLSTRGYK